MNKSESFYQSALDSIRDGIVIVDTDGKVIFFNSSLGRILGEFNSVSIFENWRKKYGLYDSNNKILSEKKAPLVNALSGKKTRDIVVTIENQFINEKRIVKILSDPIYNSLDKIEGAVAVFQDITEKTKLEEQLKKDSFIDSLTGLYNRRFFDFQLKGLFASFRRRKTIFSLAIADLDGFKKINDEFGHLAGDYVLQEVANLFKESLRVENIAFRIGGDEFCIVFPGQKADEASLAVDRIRGKLKELQLAFNNIKLNTIMSAGVSQSEEKDVDCKVIIDRADSALYRAKNQGKNLTIWTREDIFNNITNTQR